jgi:hypothetical protein
LIFTTLKAKLYAGAVVVLGVLLATVKILLKRNSRLSQRVENAEARVNRARVVAKQDTQIDQSIASHRAELINEIETSGDSSGFRDPDSLWDDADD